MKKMIKNLKILTTIFKNHFNKTGENRLVLDLYRC